MKNFDKLYPNLTESESCVVVEFSEKLHEKLMHDMEKADGTCEPFDGDGVDDIVEIVRKTLNKLNANV